MAISANLNELVMVDIAAAERLLLRIKPSEVRFLDLFAVQHQYTVDETFRNLAQHFNFTRTDLITNVKECHLQNLNKITIPQNYQDETMRRDGLKQVKCKQTAFVQQMQVRACYPISKTQP